MKKQPDSQDNPVAPDEVLPEVAPEINPVAPVVETVEPEVPAKKTRRIKVLQHYGGALTNEQRIVPGVYDADDPALFGLADHLVANGFAHEA